MDAALGPHGRDEGSPEISDAIRCLDRESWDWGLMRLRSAAEADAGGTHKQREQSSFAGALLGARWLGV